MAWEEEEGIGSLSPKKEKAKGRGGVLEMAKGGGVGCGGAYHAWIASNKPKVC